MLSLGPQVAIVDNVEKEVFDVKTLLDQLHIGYQFFNADPIESKYPEKPIETIELLFLDLYYTSNMEYLDPYMPAQWVDYIIPDGKSYFLIIFSMDTHDAQNVIELLQKMGKSPIHTIIQQKNADPINIKSLLENIEYKDQEISDTEEFYGEIIDLQKDHVLINCLLDKDLGVTQIRRFDLLPFKNKIELRPGNFILLKITTRPGYRLFEFSNVSEDISSLFNKKDPFQGLEDTPFFNFS